MIKLLSPKQKAVGLKEQVRKGRAEECAVNIVATGHVVVVELLALGAKQLHRVLSTANEGEKAGSAACTQLGMRVPTRAMHLSDAVSDTPVGSTVCFSQSVRGHEPNS